MVESNSLKFQKLFNASAKFVLEFQVMPFAKYGSRLELVSTVPVISDFSTYRPNRRVWLFTEGFASRDSSGQLCSKVVETCRELNS